MISFDAGAVASFPAGMMTSGLAVAYAVVAMWTWDLGSKVGGNALANERWIVVPCTALIHGFAFSIITILGQIALPRLLKDKWGENLLLLAIVLNGILLAVAFPVTP